MRTCLICLEDDNNLIHPNKCTCKVFLHESCLKLCQNKGINCPICRIKNKINYNRNNQILQYADRIFDNFIHCTIC